MKGLKERLSAPSDRSHPWLRPFWVRAAIVGTIFVWFAVEMTFQSYGWALLAGLAGIYGAWAYLINWTPEGDEK
ncbi:MAG: hypothetical protein AAGF58_08325 [Pseudomonadota bacterium]